VPSPGAGRRRLTIELEAVLARRFEIEHVTLQVDHACATPS
jgi:hypothetical protein